MRDNTFYNAAVRISEGDEFYVCPYSCWAICHELGIKVSKLPKQRKWFEKNMLNPLGVRLYSTFQNRNERIIALLLADLIYNEK